MVFSQTLRGGLFAAVTLVGLAVSPALAQEISPSHLAAAREAVDAIDTSEQFDQILLNAATQIKAELIVNNPDLQSKISEMVDDSAIALAPRRADLENEIARVYAKMFTEQELREISQFYNSEAGQVDQAGSAGNARDDGGRRCLDQRYRSRPARQCHEGDAEARACDGGGSRKVEVTVANRPL